LLSGGLSATASLWIPVEAAYDTLPIFYLRRVGTAHRDFAGGRCPPYEYNFWEAYDWVFRAAVILANVVGVSGSAVKASYRGLLGAMARHTERAGDLSGALANFAKVTRSYWPGLFHCYEVADLPRTDNDLEQLFGAHRYHERRASGRKVASPGLVVRGSVRLPAALATRPGGVSPRT
jgi:hypothetical protein